MICCQDEHAMLRHLQACLKHSEAEKGKISKVGGGEVYQQQRSEHSEAAADAARPAECIAAAM